MGDWFVFT
jgi:hypothetical protein